MGVFGSKLLLRERSVRSERSEPREGSEACSEQSEQDHGCELHITQTRALTEHRLKLKHNTDKQ